MTRKFYSFNSNKDVLDHVSKVKSLKDLWQLVSDIKASGTNITSFHQSTLPGIYEVQCAADIGETKRYLFFTKAAWERIGGLTDKEKGSIAHFAIFDE